MKRLLPDTVLIAIQAPVILIAVTVVTAFWLLDNCMYFKDQWDWEKERK